MGAPFYHLLVEWGEFKNLIKNLHSPPCPGLLNGIQVRGEASQSSGARTVADPAAWPWSSFLHYAKCVEGIVEIESEWTANRRDRKAGKLCPAVELPHSSQPRA